MKSFDLRNSLTVLATGAAIAIASPANAATEIDFDDGVSGQLVDDFYAGLGLTFSNAEFTSNLGLAGSSGSLGIRALGTYRFGESNAVIGTLSNISNMISIRGLDVGENGLRIDAFDTSGALLGFDEFFGPGLGVGTFVDLSVSSLGIASFSIYQPLQSTSDGIVLENFSFASDGVSGAVPEPSTWAMLLIGFFAVGIALRRRKSHHTVTVSYS